VEIDKHVQEIYAVLCAPRSARPWDEAASPSGAGDRLAVGVVEIAALCSDVKMMLVNTLEVLSEIKLNCVPHHTPGEGDSRRDTAGTAAIATPHRTPRKNPSKAMRVPLTPGWMDEIAVETVWEALPAIPSFPTWGASDVSGATAMLATSPEKRCVGNAPGSKCVGLHLVT